MSLPFDSARTRAILLDIEGTTTPNDFVTNTLFPFASAHAEEFLSAHTEDSKIRALVDQLRQHHQEDAQRDVGLLASWDETSAGRVRSAASYVRWLIAHDSKITPLKTLEGKIWEAGYRSGELRGAVYRDVAPALARWRAQGRSLVIFSSGSVLAQKLLFAFSTAGDLTAFFDGFFDTTTGPKRETESYRQIAATLSFAPADILFLSDATAELDAARAAGMQTALSLRPEVAKPVAVVHPFFTTFDEVFP